MAEIGTVGYIGLGEMGRPMAHNLLKAGYALVVHNRSRAAVEELLAAGAQDGGSPHGVAVRADAICMCLPATSDVQAVMEGPDGVLAGLAPGKLILDMSTISPAATRQLAAQVEALGADMLDAPVSGGAIGAKAATLAIMVGGRPAAFQRALPLLQSLGKTIVRMGESGAGQLTKACNQAIILATVEAVCEGLLLASKSGLDVEKVYEVMLHGWAQSRVLEVHGKLLVDSGLQPNFKTHLMIKDLGIVLESGAACGAALPAVALVREMLLAGGYAGGAIR
jgi:2-hydroxy-3-oxopropionate reductase